MIGFFSTRLFTVTLTSSSLKQLLPIHVFNYVSTFPMIYLENTMFYLIINWLILKLKLQIYICSLWICMLVTISLAIYANVYQSKLFLYIKGNFPLVNQLPEDLKGECWTLKSWSNMTQCSTKPFSRGADVLLQLLSVTTRWWVPRET